MPVKVLLNEKNDAIIKVDMDNLPSKFIRFHAHEGHIYMKDIGVISTSEFEKARELKE